MAEFCCGRWARGQHAGRVAVIAYEEVRTQTQTYRQLQQAAKQLIRVLRAQGVVQEDLVATISAGETVVPKPDRVRGALVNAHVVRAPEVDATTRLADRRMVSPCQRPAGPYKYPKEIGFVSALPMTTTGMVQRPVLGLQEEERALAESRLL